VEKVSNALHSLYFCSVVNERVGIALGEPWGQNVNYSECVLRGKMDGMVS
jgi:hypothetical protein